MVGPLDPTQSVLANTRASGTDPNTPPVEPPPPEIPGFRLITKLGQGGQGSVWLAEQLDSFKKRCALKIFPRENSASYVRELEAWKRVEEIRRATGTPHLVEGYAADVTSSGIAFVAMAFFDRGSLADRIVADGPIPTPLAVRYARHVLAALDLLHQHGFWHRDVKPQNILLGNDGIARLADYGLAKRLGATVTASCTPAFAAPEQLAGESDADGVKIDIYGVAATLFALLTGKPPVPGRPDVFLLERKKVPRPVHAPLLRALNPDPAARFARAAEFAHALAIAEPTSSTVGYAADIGTGSPAGERSVHEALTAETRAADPDRPMATTPPDAFKAPLGPDSSQVAGRKASADTRLHTTRGRRARRARIALGMAGGLFALALVLDAVSTSRGGIIAPPRGPETGITSATTTTGPVDPPRTPVPVVEVRDPIPIARVRGFGAGHGAIALTGSACVWLAQPGKVLALPLDVARAVPWSRDRLLVARRSGDLEVVGALGAFPIPTSARVVSLAGHAPTGWVAFSGPTGRIHVLRLDEQDRVVARSGFRLPDPEALPEHDARSVALSLAFDDKGERLAVASISDPEGGGRIAIYSLGEVPRLETVLQRPGPTALAWLSDRTLAVADVEGELSVIDARDGSLLRSVPIFEGTIVSLARSPSGDLLLVLGEELSLGPEASLGAARPRLLAFRTDELLGRGEARAVLDASTFK